MLNLGGVISQILDLGRKTTVAPQTPRRFLRPKKLQLGAMNQVAKEKAWGEEMLLVGFHWNPTVDGSEIKQKNT